jgi:hypothetical protein
MGGYRAGVWYTDRHKATVGSSSRTPASRRLNSRAIPSMSALINSIAAGAPGRGVATRLLGPSHHLRHCERVRDGAAGEHEVLLFQRAVEDAQVQTVRPNRAAS